MKNIICVISCIIAIIYSVIYASLGTLSGNSGALSKIGLEHPALLAVWGIITYFSLAVNITIGYRKTKYKFHIPMLAVSLIGMLLTIFFDFDYSKYNEYILHCAGSLAFSAITGICVFLLFLVRKAYVLCAVSGAILLSDLILLIIFKETAFIELMPIFSGYVMLCILNLKKENALVEIK